MSVLPGRRIRDNGIFGNLTNNPLTAGGTAINSPDLADLSIVSGDHALITLDPLREFGDSEIVMVTAHTAAATVATVQRGMFGTVARQHPISTLWLHAGTNDDFIRVVTSSTRPSDQYEGQLIYETDTDRVMYHVGSAWQLLAGNPPACRAVKSGSQSISNVTVTAVTFTGVDVFDTDAMHNPALNSSRITFNTSGLYAVGAGISWAANGSGIREMWIALNGNASARLVDFLTQAVTSGGNVTRQSVSTVYKFNAGDFIEVHAYQDSGGALNLDTSTSHTEFYAVYLGQG